MTNGHPRVTWTLFILSCAYTIINVVVGLPNGAPTSACSSLVPRHSGGLIQGSYPPYQVLPVLGHGRVRLVLGSPQGLPYEGFLIVARDVETGEYVGEFANLPQSAKALECVPGFKNAVTHSDSEKKHNLELEWTAPENYDGTVIFNATFAQDYATYWVGVESPRVSLLEGVSGAPTIDTGSPVAPNQRPISTTPPYYQQPSDNNAGSRTSDDDSFYEGCSKTKNCLGSTPECISSKTCDVAVSVLVQGEQYLFEMIGRNSKYVAVGLSTDSKMGDDSVVECTNEGGVVGLHMSWNEGKRNTRFPTPSGAVKMLDNSIRDDVIRCKFLRSKETRVEGRTYNLEREPYNLLLAAGKTIQAQGVGYHDVVRTATGKAKILSDVGEFAAASELLIRLHGALMLASWIGTASVGILLARYYKQTWVNSHLCGKDQWFAWHRFFMVLTWIMTLAAFVIIFVEIGEWSTETIHASLGLATTILCFIQPFMAAVRPNPGTPKRALFNWAHWFVGNAAHICAIIAIFFAVRLTKAELPDWVDWILVAYVVFHVLTHLILTFSGCVSDRQDSQRINAFPMKDMHPRGPMGQPDVRRDAPHSGLRQSVFGIYLVIIAAFSVVLVIITVLAPIQKTWTTFTDSVSNY